jgi:hypothetical protein
MRTPFIEMECTEASQGALGRGGVLEVPLLLPDWQVAALETAAHERGLTAGEMVRALVRDFLDGQELRAARPQRRLCEQMRPV